LLHFFATSLPCCLIQIDLPDNMLIVHCPHDRIVEDLIDELDDLCAHVRLIVGVSKVALYFKQEEILRTSTDLTI
jgi:hypothetical protein